MPTLQEINQGIVGGVSVGSVVNVLGWLIGAVIVICLAVGGYYLYYLNTKIYKKKITVFERIGNYFDPIFRDSAKQVKLGKGGFEVLYLRKSKTYRLAYGGRVGRDTYYFFIGPDGYWYNGMLGGEITSDGKVPIVTTNPSMRAQYTALEKTIDSLYSEKAGFWDKYGNWILSIAFVLIIGVLAWLIYKEISTIMGSVSGLIDKVGALTDKVTQLLANTETNPNSGLVKVA